MLPDSAVCQRARLCMARPGVPKDPSKGLEFNTVVPPKIDGDDSVGHGQIEALATALESSNHDPNSRVLGVKILNSLVARCRGHVSGILQDCELRHRSILETGELHQNKRPTFAFADLGNDLGPVPRKQCRWEKRHGTTHIRRN